MQRESAVGDNVVEIHDHGRTSRSSLAYPSVRQLVRSLTEAAAQKQQRSLDLFCGERARHNALESGTRFDETNDIDPSVEADSHLDALDLLRQKPSACYGFVYADPPFGEGQALGKYGGHGSHVDAAYVQSLRSEVQRVLRADGIAVFCGWNVIALAPPARCVRALVCCGGGEKKPMIVTVSSADGRWRHDAAEEDEPRVPCRLEERDLLADRSLSGEALRASLASPGGDLRSAAPFARPRDAALVSLRNNIDPRATHAQSHQDGLCWLRSLASGSVDVLLCEPPSIEEASLCYKRFKMVFTIDMRRTPPTSTGYAAALKDECVRVVREGGLCVWVGDSPGVGFKVRGGRREAVFVRSGPRHARYATFVRVGEATSYAAMRRPRKSTMARAAAGSADIRSVLAAHRVGFLDASPK